MALASEDPEPASSGSSSVLPVASDPTVVAEVVAKRTATSRTFELSDGQLETRLYQTRVNYRDAEGDWQPIEQELHQSSDGIVENGDNAFDVHLPEDLNQAPAKVAVDGDWVSEMPIGIRVASADVEQGIASYDASGASELQFSGLPNGLKENVVLADASAPSTYSFRVDASRGVAPSLNRNGSIVFADGEGNVVFVMPAPVVYDSDGVAAPRDAVAYSVEPADDGSDWTLDVSVDREWLAALDRAWPVTLDPSITLPEPYKDCVLVSVDQLERCGNTGFPYLVAKANYLSSGADEYARSLLNFTIGAIPASASLTSVTVGLNSPKEAKNWSGVGLYEVTHGWAEGVDWLHTIWHSNSFPWTTPGGDFNSNPVALVTPASRGGSGPGAWTFSDPSLTWLVQRWRDGIGPFGGLLLKLVDEKSRTCSPCLERRVEWESSTAPAGKKPYLSATYIEPASSDSKITAPTDGTKTAKRFLLISAWEHPGVTGVTFQYKTDKGWKDIASSQVIDQNNQNVTWPYSVPKVEERESRPLYWDASTVTEGLAAKKLQIRAVLSGDPGAGGYTKAVSAEIQKHTGGPKDAVTGVGPGSLDLMTGNFTISRTDLSIAAFNSALEFSRSFSSREAGVEAAGVLGPGWKPASPVEEAGGSAWSKLVLKEETEVEEEGTTTFRWAELTAAEGSGILAFEEEGGKFVSPPEMSGYVLYRNPSTGNVELTDPEGNRTVFSNNGSGNEYLPISVAMTGGEGNKSRMIYEVVGSNRRLKKVIAPAAPGISCPDEGSSAVDGCRLLVFNYGTITATGSPTRLLSITYYGPGEGSWDRAQYSYDSQGRLMAAWDPQISPALKETYTYNSTGQVATLTPPGQEPWSMNYGTLPGGTAVGRLTSVKRATLVESNPTSQTTIAYEVPVSGSGAPYSMSGAAVAEWGQQDLPTDATAIFPPNEVPSSPPSAYTRATVYYMDAEGQLVNVASPPGAGTSAPSITTTETDRFGSVVRELSAQNRLRALAQSSPEARAAKSRELDTQYRYSKDGTELQEEIGPMHQVRLEAGTTTQARSHRSVQYDANFKYLNGTTTPSAGETKPHAPTTETTGALLSNGTVVDKRSTRYVYNWTLRKQTEVVDDPEGSEETKSVTVYDPTTGLPTEMRQPKEAANGGGAGTTKVVYYKKELSGGKGELAKCESDTFAGLTCKVEPAAQPGTSGQPQLPIRSFLSYNQLGQSLEVTEAPPGGSTRKTVSTYDAAGRQLTRQIIGGGAAVSKVLTEYGSSTGLPTAQRFVCPETEPTCDRQSTFTTYDKLGRPILYKDADNNEATTTYDYLGRPATANDGKGTQTYRYDSTTGLPVELEDSAAGIFTASYDADGDLVKRGLPDGLTAETTFDETGAPASLTYTKASNCGTSCNWLNFAVERSISGQIVVENGTLGKDEYAYDKLGRLITARETPSGGTCTTRSYKYDKDSNREEVTTTAGLGGVCSSSGGTTQKYSYDSADRLLGEGLTYDDFGRITNLPAVFAGGKALATTYFSTDMVASQSQNGVTNTYQLDASLRQRQRLQAGGVAGTEIFHYAVAGDSPAWTERGSTWTRSIGGIGGELAATQESGKEVQLQLTNLHGDVSAVAALSPTVTELKSTLRFDEFGNPTGGSAGRFGWLGGKQRRTELSSGVIQMGARSYVPSIGRFLSPDPVFRGSANPYDYANQDPINNFDLNGEKCYGKTRAQVNRCIKWKEEAHEKIETNRRRKRHLQRAFDRLKEKMERQKSGAVPNFGAFEDIVNSVINREQKIVSGALHINCAKASGGAYSGAYFIKRAGLSLAGEYPEFSSIVLSIAGAAEGLGATLGAGAASGYC
jgi:RHS repeat-associated protein